MFDSDCPDDWLDLGRDHGCFRFEAQAGILNWFEAQDHCNTLHENAFLAEIKSGVTQELLAQHANGIADHNWWLGGADFFQEGHWRWERDGHKVDFTAWAENQPNNENHNGVTEDCLHMLTKKQSLQRLWNDHVCIAKESDEQGLKPLCQLFF